MNLSNFELTCTESAVRTPEDMPDLDWLPATVPGGVHESLLAAGRIGHPYFGDNDASVKWVEEKTWWYRTTFASTASGDDARVLLTFHCLDTAAKVWLNGEPLGDHASQFRPAVFDVTTRLRSDNELVLRFAPPLEGLTAPESIVTTLATVKQLMGDALGSEEKGESPPGVLSGDPALTLRRKGTFSWGWDFAPRLPSVGIIGPVDVRTEHRAVIDGHHIRATSVDPAARTAEVTIDVEADRFTWDGPLTARLRLISPAGTVSEWTIDIPANRGTRTFTVTDAHLWWTHDLGEPALYRAELDLLADDGSVLDTVTEHVGLRTVTLDRSPDAEGGRHFRFVVNGVPTYTRGANWVPADMMIGSVTAERCRALITKAREADMTMLRVWGGGTYEQDAFYEACDTAGILVWQDFMFACIDYPSEDPGLQAEVIAEARFQTRRLRNHPSLALWCGNNEVHAIHGLIDPQFRPGNWGSAFFHDILPEAVARHCPGTEYWPGSPWSETEPPDVNGVVDGDRHAWEVWHGVDVGAGGPTEFASHGEAVHFHRYAYDRGKFISEFGIHAAPELSTLERWTAPGTLSLHSPALLNRNKDVPKNKGDEMMEVETGLPHDLAEYLDFSMATQAEGLKFGIEHYRRRQPHNSGTLVWQLNDAWPGMSWSIIDYDLIPKAGYYYVQRSYKPVLASFTRTPDGGLELWVTNSSQHDRAVDLRIEITAFTGRPVIDERITVEVEAGVSRPVWSGSPGTVEPGPDRFAWVSSASGEIEPNRLFFAPLKELEFGASNVDFTVTKVGDRSLTIELESTGYSYLTRIAAPAAGVSFSSNYLDLRDGDRQTVVVTGLPEDFAAEQLSVGRYAGQGSQGSTRRSPR